METIVADAQVHPDQVKAEQSIVDLLLLLGEDPGREGLLKTPARVVKALREMTQGYNECPKQILSTVFEEHHDSMVVLKGIRFFSLCEHHLLPFEGEAHVGYIPTGKIVGLSKLARLVHCFARRLQVQERMTKQILDAMDEHLSPLGAGVVVSARHLCMACRGVREKNGLMITSCLSGIIKTDAAARNEFLALTR